MASRKFLQKFTAYDLILIAMLSAITIAVKVIAGVLVRLLTGSLGIPGGALAGGFYMLWMALGIAIIDKRGAAFLVSLVQSVVLLITNTPGTHGVWTFLTYLTPAIVVEVVFFIRVKGVNVLHFIFSVMLANMLGTYGSNLLFFRMSWLPLLFTLTSAAFSGVIGGFIGYLTYTKVINTGLFRKNIKGDDKDE